MTLSVTPLYAGILALMYVAMTMYVVRSRKQFRVSIGEGTSTRFQRIIRGHGNFAEYVPISLILMAIAEISGASATSLHVIGLALLAGRLLHGWCFMLSDGNLRLRVAGMILTMVPLVSGGVLCLRVATGV